MKIAGIQGVNSAPITIYAIVVVSIIMIVILLLSMVQCFRFVQSLQDKIRCISRKRHEKSCLFLKCSERLPPLNVNEGGEVNRKKYFIFKKTETYVLFCYNILNKEVNKMTKENPSNYKTLQIWIKKGIVCILIFKNVVITLRICITPQTFIYARCTLD